jgi:undecaprenyl-diphosphatase
LSNALGCILWAGVFSILGFLVGESWTLFEKWIGRAGAVVGGLVVLVIVIWRLWRWMVREEIELRLRWRAFLDRPMIAGLRRRFAPQIIFLEDRLTPGGYLGLHLTVGAMVVLLSGWWFGGIAQDVIATDPLISVDHRLSVWFDQHSTPAVTRVAEVITFIGSPLLMTVASIGVALILWRLKAWYRLIAFILAMGGGSLLNLALKQLFHRARPVFDHPLIHASGYGFPSGHMMGATLFFGFIAVLVATRCTQWRRRVLAPLLAFFLVVLVGLSRICLGAHYLSDVLAAAAASLAWLAFCITGVGAIMRYHAHTRVFGQAAIPPGPVT